MLPGSVSEASWLGGHLEKDTAVIYVYCPGNNQTGELRRSPPRGAKASALPPGLESPLRGESILPGVPLPGHAFEGGSKG